MSNQSETPDDPRAITRALIHDVNNFLTVCMTHGELALQIGDAGGMRKALDTILVGARETEARMANARKRICRGQPARSQVAPEPSESS